MNAHDFMVWSENESNILICKNLYAFWSQKMTVYCGPTKIMYFTNLDYTIKIVQNSQPTSFNSLFFQKKKVLTHYGYECVDIFQII